MSKLRIWLLINEDGTVAEQIKSFDHPVTGENPSYTWPAERVVEVAREGDLEAERPAVGGWEPVVQGVEAQLLRTVDSDRQTRVGTSRAIRDAHDRKSVEARSWLLLSADQRGSADLDLLFPWLVGEAAATGQTIDEVASGIVAAQNEAEAVRRQVDHAAIAAKRNIRDAGSINQMRSVAKTAWRDLTATD